jgi:hypothetical protein
MVLLSTIGRGDQLITSEIHFTTCHRQTEVTVSPAGIDWMVDSFHPRDWATISILSAPLHPEQNAIFPRTRNKFLSIELNSRPHNLFAQNPRQTHRDARNPIRCNGTATQIIGAAMIGIAIRPISLIKDSRGTQVQSQSLCFLLLDICSSVISNDHHKPTPRSTHLAAHVSKRAHARCPSQVRNISCSWCACARLPRQWRGRLSRPRAPL